jgi:hypothetical protein
LHGTLTHRLKRSVIQSPCIVLSHARNDSYSLQRVKWNVDLLLNLLLHAKIGELTLENDFLEAALGKAGLPSAKR